MAEVVAVVVLKDLAESIWFQVQAQRVPKAQAQQLGLIKEGHDQVQRNQTVLELVQEDQLQGQQPQTL